MDLNEQLKSWIAEQQQPGSFLNKAGLGLAQAGQTIGQDAAAGAAIMNDPRNGWIGMNPLGKVVGGGRGLGGALLGQIAYHGSPHAFEKFALSKVGTGEGAQMYGHGLYLAENPQVAQMYRGSNVAQKYLAEAAGDKGKAAQLLREETKRMGLDEADIQPWLHSLEAPDGHLYKVDIPDEAVGKMLEWGKPLSEQPSAIRKALQEKLSEITSGPMAHMWKSMQARPDDPYAADFYNWLSFMHEGSDKASAELRKIGVPGIKYLDQGSRDAGAGTRNFVIFDDQLPVIKERNGLGLTQGTP